MPTTQGFCHHPQRQIGALLAIQFPEMLDGHTFGHHPRFYKEKLFSRAFSISFCAEINSLAQSAMPIEL